MKTKIYENLAELFPLWRETTLGKVGHEKEETNFVLLKVDNKIKSHLEQELDKMDFLISKFVSDNFMRVSIGSKEHTENFLKTLISLDKRND